jgi:hypothetical protein
MGLVTPLLLLSAGLMFAQAPEGAKGISYTTETATCPASPLEPVH